MTFLIHPEHGATHAGDADLAAMKKAGWIESTPEYWLSLKGKEFKAPNSVEEQHAQILKDAPPVKNKGGRPRKVIE